jgi:two-component system phosphate regulon sensor histidine kinase PhoR
VAGTGTWLEPQLTPEIRGDLVLVLRDVTQVRDMENAHDAFLGVLSHELRTPVTTIYGNAQLLSRRTASNRMPELAADIQVEAERLRRLVDDLLVLSRVERERLEVGEEPVLLQRVIPAVVAAERRRMPETRYAVELAENLPPVLGDATYVEQIVRNLVSNAAKYGPEGGTVRVTGESRSHAVVVRVLDDGPGFPEAEAEQLFELFYRSAGTAATVGGAGIGLFVTRQLVTTMGGRIWATPRPEGGSEFGFELQSVDDAEAGGRGVPDGAVRQRVGA